MLALLGLLLLGAEPSSHDLLTGKVYSTLDGDNSRAFATHVVHHHANDSNTMHNHEDSQTTCDQRPRLGNAICEPSLTTCDQHPRPGHAICEPSLTTCDKRPRLGNAICDASPRVHRTLKHY